MVFNVHYNPTTNEVEHYSETTERENEPKPGCQLIAYAKVLPGMFNDHGICLMKVVDVKTLSGKTPKEIPEPLPNVPNKAT